MVVRAVGFDIGHTLIDYKNPLNWKSLYTPALQKVMNVCQIDENEHKIKSAVEILLRYNTRENPREYEVTSDKIFHEIFNEWGQDCIGMIKAKEAFFGFFQSGAFCFGDTIEVLDRLSEMGICTGFLTDVAYGMDNEYSLKDIDSIKRYFVSGFTSVDIGFRKPNKAGYEMLMQKLNVFPNQMLYVGDEEKDIIGANQLGIISVLINRGNEKKDWGQTHTIHSLREILSIIDNYAI